LPCSVFSTYELAREECRRLAAKSREQAAKYWEAIHGKDKTSPVPDIFLKETAKGISVCRRYKGRRHLDFVVENDVFYVKSFEVDKPTQREWW
jgi:hypothetical protein